jgi:hypothetical protein
MLKNTGTINNKIKPTLNITPRSITLHLEYFVFDYNSSLNVCFPSDMVLQITVYQQKLHLKVLKAHLD